MSSKTYDITDTVQAERPLYIFLFISKSASFRPYNGIWNPSADTWTTVLEPNIIPNILYYGGGTTPKQAGFPLWTLPIGMVIGGYFLLKRYGKKPRG